MNEEIDTEAITAQAEKLAKWLDFQFDGPQVGNQVRGLAAALTEVTQELHDLQDAHVVLKNSHTFRTKQRDEAKAEVKRLGEWIDDYKRDQEAIISRYMGELAEAKAEIERLGGVEFIHRGCDMLRVKDNEYLINERDRVQANFDEAEAELAEARATLKEIADVARRYADRYDCTINPRFDPGVLASSCDVLDRIADRAAPVPTEEKS